MAQTRRPRGAALVEYVLLLSLFTMAAVPAISNLKNDEKTALRSTSAKIGGSPVPTDPSGTLRATTTTTTLPPPTTARPNNPPTVHLPDGIVVAPATYNNYSPDVLFDPDGDPIASTSWTSVNGATWQNQSRDQGTNNAVLKWTSSGWKTICFSATDSIGATGSDCCDVCVTTGVVSAALTTTANYKDATNSQWRMRATVNLSNGIGSINVPLVVSVRFDFSDGTSETKTCTTSTASCTINSTYKPTSITWIKATVTNVAADVTTPCFGSWNGTTSTQTINLTSVTLVTTTTTRATTTTTTTRGTTTTTRATTTSSTTRATTTTSTTTTTTTTTRPTTTTFSS